MKHRVILCTFSLVVILSLALSACGASTTMPVATEPPTTLPATSVPPIPIPPTPTPTVEPTATKPTNPSMILATTSSMQDSGLLDVLVPAFEARTGYTVKVVAVGSGAALTLGQQGNADVLLVHSPAAEKTFMDGSFGSDRRLVMHNDFVIVGSGSDSAGIKTAASAVDAFQKIAAASAPFVSRGDKSGTNAMELSLWKSAQLDPKGKAAPWYIESGQNMGVTLSIASEKSYYTLTDRATYLANKSNLSLEILYEGDKALLNVYHVIIVNHDKWPNSNLDGATAFADYVVSEESQALIGNFGLDKYGEQLFVPDAGKTEADPGLK
jgi:tungstate transport system substrate-binding protein